MDKLLTKISKDFRLGASCFPFLDTSRKRLGSSGSKSEEKEKAEEEQYMEISPQQLENISKDFGNAEYYFDTTLPGTSITVCKTTTTTTTTKNKNELEGSDSADVVDSFTCPVCFDDNVPNNQRFDFWCGKQHSLCFECAIGHVMSYVNDGRPDIVCFDSKCKHRLLPEEIAIIFGHGNIFVGMSDPRYTTLDLLKRDHAINKDPLEYTTCPQPGCSFIAARSSKGAADHVVCDECNHTFCSNCLEPYHYRSTCIEKRQILDDWRNWIITGRERYWRKDKAVQRRESKKILKAEQKRIKEVIKNENADEKWKSQNCRHCPNCDRLVNRIEGCNSMYCGADYHSRGGVGARSSRKTVGCHQNFNWESARQYKSVKAGSRVKIDESLIAGGGKNNQPVHQYISCDSCGKTDISGLRFECINCPSFNVCEECDCNPSIRHADGDHIFRIIQDPSSCATMDYPSSLTHHPSDSSSTATAAFITSLPLFNVFNKSSRVAHKPVGG